MSRLGRLTWLAFGCLLIGFSAVRAADNELSTEEEKDGYQLLFNGKDLTGWRRNAPGHGGWHVEEGQLCLSKGGGLLYADKEFDNFVLKIDFKMSKGCNSGVFFRVGNPRDEVQTGLEVQVQDDHGRKPNRNTCGSIYDLVAPSKDVVKPAGEWNSFVITADRNLLTVELNGEKVTQMNLDEWDQPGRRPDGTGHKYAKAIKDFPRKGLIGLQDHGAPLCYRNIKIMPLK